MAKRILSNEPQMVHEDCWYYEENSGIEVVLSPCLDTGFSRVVIPWRMLSDTFRRAEAAGKLSIRKKKKAVG